MEILTPEQYDEFGRFNEQHENGSFMQSPHWAQVKREWMPDVVVSRDESGAIKGGILILAQRRYGATLLYAPRGPVCDHGDRATWLDLLEGVREVAKRRGAYALKIDPYVLAEDEQTIELIRSLGFRFTPNAPHSAVIQTRRDYMVLDLQGYDEESLIMSIGRKTRNYVRHAQKHGVETRDMTHDENGLREFYDCYAETGRRQGFAPRGIEYFERICNAFGDDARLFVTYYEGEAMCAGLLITSAGRSCYVYGGSRGTERKMHGTFLQQWEMMRYALARGSRLYDMLGVVTDENESPNLYGVYVFKKNFQCGQVVEHAGEFDLVFRPGLYALASFALKRKMNKAGRRKQAAPPQKETDDADTQQ